MEGRWEAGRHLSFFFFSLQGSGDEAEFIDGIY
jgi:hypothetical protein